MIEALRLKHKLPALAAVIIKEGQICEQSATGIRKSGEKTPVTPQDKFHIGSCTKSMTATLVAISIEKGWLKWDTTIGQVFPEWKERIDQQYLSVTVEQLLKHESGLATRPPPDAWRRAWQEVGSPREQRIEFAKSVLSTPPESKPGTMTNYSNQGYAIVGAILEKIADREFESLMSEYLFEPLGMTSAGFGPPGDKSKDDQPWGHSNGLLGHNPVWSDNPPVLTPAGRVHCSLEDMAKFCKLHLQGDERILSAPSLQRLHAAKGTDPASQNNAACGWFVLKRGWAGDLALNHNGSNTMWYMVIWLAPKRQFGVVVATNAAGSVSQEACDDVASAMIKKWLP
jgi:CubicO group peptidase (beta-lactamase class C family)